IWPRDWSSDVCSSDLAHRDAEGRNTFEENFPGAFMVTDWNGLSGEQVDQVSGCDLVMCHAECGAFSNLRIDKRPDARGACDIPQIGRASCRESVCFQV